MRVFVNIHSRVPGRAFSRRMRFGEALVLSSAPDRPACPSGLVTHPDTAETALRLTAPLISSRRLSLGVFRFGRFGWGEFISCVSVSAGMKRASALSEVVSSAQFLSQCLGQAFVLLTRVV